MKNIKMRGFEVKKFGFTLAEVLITLSIVGVVTAMTVPSLMMNAQKKSWANALATQITNFENATKNLIVEEDALDLFETKLCDIELKYEDLPKYLKNLETYNEENFLEFYNDKIFKIDKTLYVDEKLSNIQNFSLKNGGTTFIYNLKNYNDDYKYTEKESIEKGLNFRGAIADVVIDVNGKNLPNTLGRDIFQFIMDENGKLHAVGSKSYANFMNNENLYWTKTCADDNKGSGDACTGRLVEKNFVMDY